jgi:hypothetical protein
VSHWIRANPVGSARTACAPAPEYRNHWYQNARAWLNAGIAKTPRGWNASASVAIAEIRSGNSAASVYAALAPQSCPTTGKSARPRVSARSMASCASAVACPVRGVCADRNRVPPLPRRYGAIVRQPAACSRAATGRQPRGATGQPWSRRTGRPSAGPPAS